MDQFNHIGTKAWMSLAKSIQVFHWPNAIFYCIWCVWNNAKENTEIVQKGIEKTGLVDVPFDPDRIEYSKFYNPDAASAKFKHQSKRNVLSASDDSSKRKDVSR